MLRVSTTYGLYSGLSMFAFVLILYFININPLGNYSWLGVWIPVVFICLGTLNYRQIEGEGYLTYGRGFSIGFLISIIAGLVGGILIYILCEFINPKLIDMNIDEALQQLEKAEQYMGESLYKKAIESVEEMRASDLAMGAFQSKVLGGILISLITAGIYKKNKSIFETDNTIS